MAHPADPNQPRSGADETKYEKEQKGHEGTLGGQPPLGAPAGVQGTGPGGVLVEKGKLKKDRDASDASEDQQAG